jgi:hypothetical protein
MISELTPTLRKITDNRRAFHASIAAQAAKLNKKPEAIENKTAPASAPMPKFEPPIVWPVFPSDEIFIERPIARIQRVVAEEYGIRLKDMYVRRKTAKIVFPRQIAMFLVKQLTPHSLPEIGRRFGGRDHTTVLYAVKKIAAMKQNDSKLAGTIERLKQVLR